MSLVWWRYWNLADRGVDALTQYSRSGRFSPEWRVPFEEARELLVDALQVQRILETMSLKGYRHEVLEAWGWARDVIKALRKEEFRYEALEAEFNRCLALLDLLLVPEKPMLSRKDAEAITAFFKALRQVAMARQEQERQERDKARHDPFGYRHRVCAVA